MFFSLYLSLTSSLPLPFPLLSLTLSIHLSLSPSLLLSLLPSPSGTITTSVRPPQLGLPLRVDNTDAAEFATSVVFIFRIAIQLSQVFAAREAEAKGR